VLWTIGNMRPEWKQVCEDAQLSEGELARLKILRDPFRIRDAKVRIL
jgi:hypothetical protein